jgi:hypothetical protein
MVEIIGDGNLPNFPSLSLSLSLSLSSSLMPPTARLRTQSAAKNVTRRDRGVWAALAMTSAASGRQENLPTEEKACDNDPAFNLGIPGVFPSIYSCR